MSGHARKREVPRDGSDSEDMIGQPREAEIEVETGEESVAQPPVHSSARADPSSTTNAVNSATVRIDAAALPGAHGSNARPRRSSFRDRNSKRDVHADASSVSATRAPKSSVEKGASSHARASAMMRKSVVANDSDSSTLETSRYQQKIRLDQSEQSRRDQRERRKQHQDSEQEQEFAAQHAPSDEMKPKSKCDATQATEALSDFPPAGVPSISDEDSRTEGIASAFSNEDSYISRYQQHDASTNYDHSIQDDGDSVISALHLVIDDDEDDDCIFENRSRMTRTTAASTATLDLEVGAHHVPRLDASTIDLATADDVDDGPSMLGNDSSHNDRNDRAGINNPGIHSVSTERDAHDDTDASVGAVVTAMLVPEDDVPNETSQLEEEQILQRAQQFAQDQIRRELMGSVVQAEDTQVIFDDEDDGESQDNKNEESEERTESYNKKRLALSVFMLLAIIGIIVGAVVGTRCNRDPTAPGCPEKSSASNQTSNQVAVNDVCQNAVPISNDFDTIDKITFTTNGATQDDIFPNLQCTLSEESGAQALTGPDVWFAVDGNGNPFEIATRSSTSLETSVSILAGTCQNLSCLKTKNCGQECALTWNTAINQTYYILVRGVEIFNFFVEMRETIQNDICELATTVEYSSLSVGETISSSTLDATQTNFPSSCAIQQATEGPNIWYEVFGTGLPFHASTCRGPSPSTTVSVHTGECGALLCLANTTSFECGESGNNNEVIWVSEKDEKYYISISTDPTEADRNFDLVLRETKSNELCGRATLLDGTVEMVQFIDSLPTTATADFIPECSTEGGSTISANGLWYEILGDGSLQYATVLHSVDVSIQIFAGACNELNCFVPHRREDTEDDAFGVKTEIAWLSDVGKKYFMYVLISDSNKSDEMEIKFESSAVNSICETALLVTPGIAIEDPTVIQGSTLEALNQTNVIGGCGAASEVVFPGLWYTVVGDGSVISASTCLDHDALNRTEPALMNTQLSIFSGECGNLKCITGNDQSCEYLSSTKWFGEADETYFILVHGYDGGFGNFNLTVNAEDIPLSDSCESARDIEVGTSSIGSTIEATRDTVASCGGFTSSGPGIWFTTVGTGNRLVVTTCGGYSDFRANIAVFTGLRCSSMNCFSTTSRLCDPASKIGTTNLGVLVEFDTTEGQLYNILVHGADEAVGTFALRLDDVA